MPRNVVACRRCRLAEAISGLQEQAMPVAVEAETLPTLDLRRFDGDASERLLFLEDLRSAARSAGSIWAATALKTASSRKC
jgi:hypothetical protein